MKFLFSFVLALSLVACSGTGGIIGGLIPAPKFLKGEVTSDGFYISENQQFSVLLPHPPNRSDDDSYEWTYTKVWETNQEGVVVGAIFGPAAFDLNQYHAVIINSPPVEDLVPYVENLFNGKAEGRERGLQLIGSEQFSHDSRQAFYNVYESSDAYLVLSLVASTDFFYVVEIDVLKNTARNLPERDELLRREWDVFNEFFESFSIL